VHRTKRSSKPALVVEDDADEFNPGAFLQEHMSDQEPRSGASLAAAALSRLKGGR
jgi:hypothetical protein